MAADAYIVRSVDLLRFEAGLRRSISAMLADAAREVSAHIAGAAKLSEARKDTLRGTLTAIKETLASAHKQAEAHAQGQLFGLAESESRWAVAVALGGGNLPSEAVLKRLVDGTLIQGAPMGEWWRRQSGDAQFRFVSAVRQGVIEGETNVQIVSRLLREGGPAFQNRRNVEAMVRTSVHAVSAQARLDAYRANSAIIGVRQVSTLDSRTTLICMAYDQQTWDLDGNPIGDTKLPFINDGGASSGVPRHWNCRSALVPITELSDRLPPTDRASADGPMPGSLTFEEWLSTKDEAFQDALLGKGRARLWRAGKISMTQLLDQSGRPLTLAELRVG